MGLGIANCPKCGKIYAKNPRNMCPDCYKQIEDQFAKCVKYLRENRRCSLKELSDGTGVSTSMISNFIREGRISIAEFPNMSYDCEVCGAAIREGHLCEACRTKLSRDLQNMKEIERKRAAQPQPGFGFLKDR
ncbi:TIGR03826 family flagellar region protein [Paenibacillus thermotolerans]|uniref:TIGR03826 family flagellar region protein n=1 Tax=Paenibacillus thermotolerans TaxID=3027807 RepID=UPI0023689821|nr:MULTISPECIES: TIGR03826 family flagellar region protein [unclassified Paenibacillus]